MLISNRMPSTQTYITDDNQSDAPNDIHCCTDRKFNLHKESDSGNYSAMTIKKVKDTQISIIIR